MNLIGILTIKFNWLSQKGEELHIKILYLEILINKEQLYTWWSIIKNRKSTYSIFEAK